MCIELSHTTASTHAAQTFKQTHKQTKNVIGDQRETFTKRRKLNKQNSRNVNKNRMRERARHNKHTHTQDEINIGENVELRTLKTFYIS